MSLLLVRVDDRLVHGQVMVGWRSYLGATQVLVANDRLAQATVARYALEASAPRDVALVIDSVESIVRRLLEGEFSAERSILLFENLGDTRRAMECGLCLDHLNLGGLRTPGGRQSFSPSLALSEDDFLMLSDFLCRGIHIDVQMVPREKLITLSRESLARAGAASKP